MTAWTAQGAIAAIGDGASPESFSAIGEVISFDGPKQSRPAIDTSSLASSIRTAKVGLRDGGTVTMEVHLDPADTPQDTMYTQFTAGTEKNYRLTLTDTAPAETITFAAVIIEDSGPVVQMDQTIKRTFVLKVNSSPTWA